ncbi:MAG TPA: hypothetical protein VHK66_08530 [Microvirga sp.]|jgi:hypothetical protein|nr:hypothetical protein [Microvirga sp.]
MNRNGGAHAGAAAAPASRGGRPGTSLRDCVRALIRAEVSRAEPIDNARRSLELIVESSVRYRETNGELEVTVVGDDGQARTRPGEGGRVPLSIADYVEELRRKHPTLFRFRGSSAPSLPAREASFDVSAADEAKGRPAEPKSDGPEGSQPERDWLEIASDREADAREGSTGGAVDDRAAGGPRRTGQASAGQLRSAWTSVARAGASVAARADARLRSAVGALRDTLGARIDRAAARRSLGVEPASALSRFLLPAAGAAAAFAALLVGSALLVPRLVNPSDAPVQVAGPAAPSPREPAATGTVEQAPRPTAPPEAAGPIRGVPEVLDTSTLRLQDRVVRLFGVEWARGGGDPDDLVKYLRNREVSCEPSGSADSYRCQVDGQDLSRVVLFNGGGRTTSDASPELRAAEDHARSSRIGVWKDQRPAAP